MLILHLLLWLSGSLAALALGEYLFHRFAMHQPLRPLTEFFQQHAIRHHRDGRLDTNVDMPVGWFLLMLSPVLTLVGWCSLLGLAVAVAVAVGYARLWTRLHRSFHGLEQNWTPLLPWYGDALRHHLRHHDRPNRNFGTVFIFSDYLFGTKI